MAVIFVVSGAGFRLRLLQRRLRRDEMVLGETGARAIAAGIAISTLGFLSQGMLTAPRVYFAMAEDGLFFKSVGRLHPKSHVPVIAIVMQGVLAIVIALSGRYEQILNYVVSVDFIFSLSRLRHLCVQKRKAEQAEAQKRGRISGARSSVTMLCLLQYAGWL